MHRLFSTRLICAGLLWQSVLASSASAQQRVILPEGTVFTVRTQTALSSASARQGTTFQTTVTDSVFVEGFTVIPAGSRVSGVVTAVRPADDRQSGILGVSFEELRLPDGSTIAIDGRLTSTDPAERRQIDSRADSQVVLVGGRRGVGAAIGGVQNPNDPVGSLLGALGGLLSEGADVNLPSGTTLAVQLERGLALAIQGPRRTAGPDAFVILTSPEMIRAAQRELGRRGYYRGALDGQLGSETQRALLEFQIDNGILATGNLDGRTAAELGLEVELLAGLSPNEAALLRRNAQLVLARYRDQIGISASQRLDAGRFYGEGELALYFALSAFADNASVYEQMVSVSGNASGVAQASEALVDAGHRVDQNMTNVRLTRRVEAAWNGIQRMLEEIDPDYLSGA
jgi:peptidoglycan hydrolase-like protein with peptidoglycan-binding domain